MGNRLHPVHKRTRADIQICQDCDGVGSIPDPEWAPRFMPCDTCTGQGMFVHRAPYRLANGEWSDGVDRSDSIRRQLIRDRIKVSLSRWSGEWQVHSKLPRSTGRFNTWEKAIAYADRLARTNQGENK